MRNLLHSAFLACVLVLGGSGGLLAEPGQGLLFDSFRVRPGVSVAFTSDSNVDFSSEEDDTSFEVEYGVQLESLSESFELTLLFEGLSETYSDFSELDHDDILFDVDFATATPGGTRIGAGYKLADVQDVDVGSGTIENYDRSDFMVSLGREIGDRLDLTLEFDLTDKDYESDELFDWETTEFALVGRYQASDRSQWLLEGSGGVQSGDANDGDGDTYGVLTGIESRGTDRIVYRAAAGIAGVNVPGGSQVDNISELALDISVEWSASEKVDVRLETERYIRPSGLALDNYDVRMDLTAALVYKLNDRIKASASYSHDSIEFSERVGGASKDESTLSKTALRLDYTVPGEWGGAFLKMDLSSRDTVTGRGSSDRDRFTGGLSFRY